MEKVTLFALLLLCTTLLLSVKATIDLTNYDLTWNQDFTTMTNLSVSPWGPLTNGLKWIAHKPDHEDWVVFQDPSGPYQPFALANGYLTIRAQRQGPNSYTGGMLSSLDQWGNGFAQKYGYFECSAKLPTGLGTWPAFWLMDAAAITNRGLDAHEIDVVEQYGDGPALLRSTIHYWPSSSSGNSHWAEAGVSIEPTMETGFHTYGVDLQPNYITFYYDREIIYQVPNFINVKGLVENKYDRSMYIMLNLAYGGGGAANQPSALDVGGPRDMLVKYVKVWQGTGGSVLANATNGGASSLAFGTDWQILNGTSVTISKVSLTVSNTGDLVVYDTTKSPHTILWHNNKSGNCGAYCKYIFQGDGNFVGYSAAGASYLWDTATYNKNASAVLLSNTAPYLSIVNQFGKAVWSAVPPTPINIANQFQ